MPKLSAKAQGSGEKKKGKTKRRRSAGDSAASPAGPENLRAGPATEEMDVDIASKAPMVGSKAPTQPDDPTFLDAETASPKLLWTLKHSTTPEFQEICPKGQEFNFAFREDYRQEGELSSDDDEESMPLKKSECERVHDIQKNYGEQLHVKEPFGEDAPFFSNYDWPSRSNLLFGTANEMKQDIHEEVARRVAIMVSFILEKHPSMVSRDFLVENPRREVDIPRKGITISDLMETGWTSYCYGVF